MGMVHKFLCICPSVILAKALAGSVLGYVFANIEMKMIYIYIYNLYIYIYIYTHLYILGGK